jgi:hypothetical protein
MPALAFRATQTLLRCGLSCRRMCFGCAPEDAHPNRFDVSSIDCRSDTCEIRVAGRPGGDHAADMHDFRAGPARMHQQAWSDHIGFDDMGIAVSSLDNGIPVFVVYITRK